MNLLADLRRAIASETPEARLTRQLQTEVAAILAAETAPTLIWSNLRSAVNESRRT